MMSVNIPRPNTVEESDEFSDSAEMSTFRDHIYIERTDATKNLARYYALDVSTTLFGEVCLTRTWGRIGLRGQTKTRHCASVEDAMGVFHDILRRKTIRGYHPVPGTIDVSSV